MTPIEIKDGYGRLMGIRGDNLGHDDLIAQGMFERRDDQWTDADRVLLPAEFSLSCTECDDGSHIQSIEHAKAEGWAEVFFDPGGCSWNYLGLCPACKAREVARVS